jgi:hypothetical protein
MIVATALFQWPVQAGRAADATVTTTLTVVNGGLATGGRSQTQSEKAAASNTHEALLYKSWLAGTFGQSDSNTAAVYGPQLFDATALTWREARILRQDPTRGQTIIDAKQRRFADVAARVKSADPDAYEYLTGKRSETRVGYALLATLGALFALPFLLGAFLLVLASFLIIRFAVMFFPAFATLAVFPAMRAVATGIGSLVAAALINGVVFGIAAIVVLRAIGLLLDPKSPLPPWLALTLMLLVSVVMWVVLRPVRRLGAMLLPGSVRVVSPLQAPLEESGSVGQRGRHARIQDSGATEQRQRAAEEALPSEIHTIAESEPSAGLPSAYGVAEPRRLATSSPDASAGMNHIQIGRAPVPSRNGNTPAASEVNSLEEPASEEQVRRQASPQPPPTRPDGRAPMGPPMRRSVGNDGASVPLTARSTTEEATGPIYIPGPSGPSNGRGSDGPVTTEEVMSPVYRPSGKGRSPTKSGE